MHVLQIPFNQNANDAELTSISNWARDILMMSAVVVVCSIFTDTVLWEELNLLLWIRRVSFELASTCVKKKKELEWIRKKRGHPDLNQGPLDLQSNALPLSYTPNYDSDAANKCIVENDPFNCSLWSCKITLPVSLAQLMKPQHAWAKFWKYSCSRSTEAKLYTFRGSTLKNRHIFSLSSAHEIIKLCFKHAWASNSENTVSCNYYEF